MGRVQTFLWILGEPAAACESLQAWRLTRAGPGESAAENAGSPAQLSRSNKVLSSRAGADVRLIFDLNGKLRAPERATPPHYLWELQRFR